MNLKVCCGKEGKQGKWLKGKQEVGGLPGEVGSKENLWEKCGFAGAVLWKSEWGNVVKKVGENYF